MKTKTTNAQTRDARWYVVSGQGKTLGRLATRIAMHLRGKHRADFTPHVAGDHVVVTHAAEIGLTGKKAENKVYYHHTGYPGGIRETKYSELMEKDPARVLMKAVKGMLPNGPLGRKMLTQLRIYSGAEHPHAAQQPITMQD